MSRVKILFEDLSVSSSYEFLELGKNDDELREIAARKGIPLPSRDIAIFKCKYAMVDQTNKNKCTLPKKEVKKALKTLACKAIDKDHLRRATIGLWLEGQLEDEDIIAYGAFWKSNFPEEYAFIKERMSSGKMKISFEAWGDREFKENGNYDLTNIEFAGGALLFDSEPAFPDAEVMEFSSQKVLEFAKVVEEEAKKKKCKACGKEVESLNKEDVCPDCIKTDEENKEKKVTQTSIPSDEAGKETKEEAPKQPVTEEAVKTEEKPKTEDAKTEQDMTDLPKTQEKGGSGVVDELLKKYEKASVEELVKFLDTKIDELSQLNSKLSKDSEDAKLMVENSKIEAEKAREEAKLVKAELDKKLAAEKASFVKARRDELGEEFAKDLTDEDICSDLKFENAKLKKELATLKKASVEKPKEEGLPTGEKPEEIVTASYKKQESIQANAWKIQDNE